MIFSGKVELMRRAASDDFGRRTLARNLSNFRSLVLWGSLPVIVSLLVVSLILVLSLISIQRGKLRLSDLISVSDIILWVTGSLLVVAFASLYLLIDLEKCLRRLSALNDEQFPAGSQLGKKLKPAMSAGDNQIDNTIGLRRSLKVAFHDLDEFEVSPQNNPDDPSSVTDPLPESRGSHPDALPEMLGETARIDESTETGDLGGIEGSLLKHPLSGENTGLDEELLGSDPEGGAEAALKLAEGLPAHPRYLLDLDRPRKITTDDFHRLCHGLEQG